MDMGRMDLVTDVAKSCADSGLQYQRTAILKDVTNRHPCDLCSGTGNIHCNACAGKGYEKCPNCCDKIAGVLDSDKRFTVRSEVYVSTVPTRLEKLSQGCLSPARITFWDNSSDSHDPLNLEHYMKLHGNRVGETGSMRKWESTGLSKKVIETFLQKTLQHKAIAMNNKLNMMRKSLIIFPVALRLGIL